MSDICWWNKEFLFFRDLFHQIMPHADTLVAQLQKRNIDAAHTHTHRVTTNFVDAISKVCDSVPSLCARHGDVDPGSR